MRGTAVPFLREPPFTRITPARAGNSPCKKSWGSGAQDHPRACGEQILKLQTQLQSTGSPPRVRGTASGLVYMMYCGRITPARAGNRPRQALKGPAGLDHPRACGEQLMVQAQMENLGGSPPRVRGTGRQPFARARRRGITPARAGNRPRRPRPHTSREDHPRACGEQILIGGASSISCWITPARAGNSVKIENFWIFPWDHPRACGEQNDNSSTYITEEGSPPRVRGTEGKRGEREWAKRITPARAGNSI